MTSSTPLPVYLHLASTTETSELSTVEHVKDIPSTPRDALVLHRLAAYSAAIGGLAEDGGLAVFAASQHVQRLGRCRSSYPHVDSSSHSPIPV